MPKPLRMVCTSTVADRSATAATLIVATILKARPFAASPRTLAAVGEDQDVGEQDGRDEPVQDLGLDEELNEVAGDQGDGCADEDLAGEQAEEQRGLRGRTC